MINENTYLNSAAAALDLSSKGLKILPKASSLLAQLNATASGIWSDDPDPAHGSTLLKEVWISPTRGLGERTVADEMYQTTCMTSDREQTSAHTRAMIAAADQLAPIATSHISIAKNTVAPIVTDLAEKLHVFVQNRPMDPSSTFSITSGVVPMLVKDESFMSDLEIYANLDVEWKGFRTNLLPQDEAGYFQTILDLGNIRLNDMVKEWLGRRGLDFIKYVYLSHFVQDWEAGNRYPQFKDIYTHDLKDPSRSPNVYDALDMNIAIYLIANKLMMQPPEGSSGNLSQYTQDMRQAKEFSGAGIWKCIRAISRQISGKLLISIVDSERSSVVVHAPIYDEFLQSGGTPDTVLGVMVSGRPAYSLSVIQEQAEDFKKIWGEYVTLVQTDLKGKLVDAFRSYARAEVMNGMSTLSDVEKDFQMQSPTLRARVEKLVEDELDRLDHRLLEDIDHTALHLVAKCRFFYTSSYEILYQMKVAAAENPKLTPREAAMLSAIKYLSDFMASMITVSK